jgi:hypothetical protein
VPGTGVYTVAKVPDGDVSFGNKSGEIFTLSDSPSDYPTGGYSLVGGEAVTNNPSLASKQNIDLWRIDTVQAWGQNLLGTAALTPVWDTVYQKLRFVSSATGAEVASGVDLSGVVFLLCAIGT